MPPETVTPRSVTIRDVAARAGVSTATVSRVMSGPSGVGPEIRSRVEAAVREFRYEPNRAARNLRTRRRKLAGIVIPDLQNPFFTGVVHGVEAVLCDEGYTLLLGHSDGVVARERLHLSVLRAEGAAGLVLIPGNQAESDFRLLADGRTPVVAVDRAPVGLCVDLVKTANREGARQAIEHLLRLGHREIALINGPEHFDVARERLEGYRDGLQAAGVTVRPEFVIHSDFRQAGGGEAMRSLLNLPTHPKAVFIANNLMTLGALEAIHERGLKIPVDIAVVSYDDMPWATSLQPPLTAVAQPTEELGRTAAQLLLERIREPDRPIRQVILQTRLVVRASCGALSRTTATPRPAPVPSISESGSAAAGRGPDSVIVASKLAPS